MSRVATYVFLDLETTGIPVEENNRTKITELSLVAVKRDHVLDTRPGAAPRVQHKLTLCLNPGRAIPVSCTNVTGLSNELLEFETGFNKQVCELINNFLSLLQKPVCLIAQNGLSFDYPILRNHFERMKVSTPDDLLCADCFHAFYDILEEEKRNNLPEKQQQTNPSEVLQPDSYYKEEKVGDNKDVNHITPSHQEDDLLAPNTLQMKLKNETTPKQAPKPTATTPIKYGDRVSKARRKFPWSQGSKPKDTYKLKDIYERVLNRPSLEAHQAENDCIMALECSVAKAKDFVKWVDENYIKFCEIKPMGF